jgi:hypothetical protein
MRRFAWIVILVLLNASCATLYAPSSEEAKKECGILSSAVTFAGDKVIGEYGNCIPEDFDAAKFLKLVEHKIPRDYYEALNRYNLKFDPKGSYFLIVVLNPKDNSVVMFDYSCTPELDGPICQELQKYDTNNLSTYDKCISK